MKDIRFDFELFDEYKGEEFEQKIKDNPEAKKLYEKYGEQYAALCQIKDNLSLENGSKYTIGEVKNRPVLVFGSKENSQLVMNTQDKNISILFQDEAADKMSAETMRNILVSLEGKTTDGKKGTGVDLASAETNDAHLQKLLDELESFRGINSLTPDKLDEIAKKGESLTGGASKTYVDAVAKMRAAIKSNMGKFGGTCRSAKSSGGYTVFNIYPFNPDLRSEAEKEDKEMVPDARLYVKQDKDGKTSLKYHMKHNSPITDQVADSLADVAKEAGHTHMNIKNTMGPDRMKIMTSLSKKGIVPTGVYISAEKAAKLLDGAKGSMSEAAFAKFKYNLALSMSEYNKANGKGDADNVFISDAIAAYENRPFKSAWDKTLQDVLEKYTFNNKGVGNDAEKSLGAMYAMSLLGRSFLKGATIESMLKSQEGARVEPGRLLFANEEERKKFAEITKGTETMSDLSPVQLQQLFNMWMPRCEQEAQKALLEGAQSIVSKHDARKLPLVVPEILGKGEKEVKDLIKDFKKIGIELDDPKINTKITRYKRGEEYIANAEKKQKNAHNNNQQQTPQGQQQTAPEQYAAQPQSQQVTQTQPAQQQAAVNAQQQGNRRSNGTISAQQIVANKRRGAQR